MESLDHIQGKLEILRISLQDTENNYSFPSVVFIVWNKEYSDDYGISFFLLAATIYAMDHGWLVLLKYYIWVA